MARLAALTLALVTLVACSRSTPIENEELTVACGMCILDGEPRGCYWAARYEGEVLPVVGPGVPTDHDSHGPGGMCTMERTAVITGTVDDERIVADRFELREVDVTAPVDVHDHEH